MTISVFVIHRWREQGVWNVFGIGGWIKQFLRITVVLRIYKSCTSQTWRASKEQFSHLPLPTLASFPNLFSNNATSYHSKICYNFLIFSHLFHHLFHQNYLIFVLQCMRRMFIAAIFILFQTATFRLLQYRSSMHRELPQLFISSYFKLFKSTYSSC